MPGHPSTALQRPDLSGAFEEYDVEASRQGFVGHLVAPPIDVALQSANIGKLPIESLLAERSTRRNPDGTYSRQDYDFSTFNYATEEHGAEERVDDRLAKIYGHFFSAEMVATKRAVDAVLRAREKRIAELIFNATTWAALTTAIIHEWDDATNAVPVTDVQAASESVFTQSGLIANALIANAKVIRGIRNTAQVIDRLKYSGHVDPRNVSLTDLAQLLFPDVPGAKIIVAGAPRNSANPGQDVSLSRIWEDEYAMVARVATGPDMQEPCVARLFHFIDDGSELDCRIESYRAENTRGDIVRARNETDEKVMYAEAGHLLSNATTI